MKKFNNYNRYISLKGLDNNLVERFSNLNGKQINECCCGCGCDAKCCEPTTCCNNSNTFIKYYSDYDVINNIKGQLKVQDLFDIHRQYNNRSFFFGNASPADVLIPLYFSEPNILSQSLLQQANTGPQYNKKLYDFIVSLLKKYKMTYPIVLIRQDGSIQLYFIKGTGTNGKEGSIKSSLQEIASLLDTLENSEEITWSQVLDISIDNLDDVYTFVITCTVDINKFQE